MTFPALSAPAGTVTLRHHIACAHCQFSWWADGKPTIACPRCGSGHLRAGSGAVGSSLLDCEVCGAKYGEPCLKECSAEVLRDGKAAPCEAPARYGAWTEGDWYPACEAHAECPSCRGEGGTYGVYGQLDTYEECAHCGGTGKRAEN